MATTSLPGRNSLIAAHEDTIQAALLAAQAIADKNGHDVVILDISRLLVIADIFLIATGTSNRHVRTLIVESEQALKDHLGRRVLRREGVQEGRWSLLDYGDLVIHVFDRETRDYYDLERLWGDAPRIAFESAAAEA